MNFEQKMKLISIILGDEPSATMTPQAAPKTSKTPFEIGKCYLIRTITMIDIGRVVEVYDDFIVLEDASWIPDTGRFNECLKNGTVSECEPFWGKSIVSKGAIVDAAEWKHELKCEAVK